MVVCSSTDLDNLPASILCHAAAKIVVDAREDDHPIISVSEGFCGLTGYGRPEVIGRNCRLLQGARTDPRSVAAIRRQIHDGLPYAGIVWNHRKDGTPFLNDITITPVYDHDRELRYFIGSLALAEEVAINQEHGDDALAEIGLAALSHIHDYNNHLMLILSHCERMMLQQQLPDSVAEHVRAMEAVVDVSAESSRQLLSMVHHGGSLAAGSTCLTALVGEVVDEINLVAGGRVQLTASASVAVSGLAALIRHIVFSLISNSVKYSRELVLCAVRHQVEGGQHYGYLSIADRGPGFTDRGGPIASAGGNGVGVAVAKRLTAKLKGTLLYSPRPGGGTQALLRLPLAKTIIEDSENR